MNKAGAYHTLALLLLTDDGIPLDNVHRDRVPVKIEGRVVISIIFHF
jgi:hypothetical protein